MSHGVEENMDMQNMKFCAVAAQCGCQCKEKPFHLKHNRLEKLKPVSHFSLEESTMKGL